LSWRRLAAVTLTVTPLAGVAVTPASVRLKMSALSLYGKSREPPKPPWVMVATLPTFTRLGATNGRTAGAAGAGFVAGGCVRVGVVHVGCDVIVSSVVIGNSFFSTRLQNDRDKL
jgi:hypothetical protein